MRRLRPDNRGIVVPQKPVIRTGGQVTMYNKPSPALSKIDRLREGVTPRICITRKQGGLGDVMMTLPTVRAISNKYKTCVDYGTDFDYLDGALVKVFEGNPFVDRVVQWDAVSGDDYDAIIDLTCPCVAHENPKASPINRIDLFARHAGITLHDHSIDYFMTEEEKEWAAEYIYQNRLSRHKLILLQPSSSTTRRDAPVSKLRQAVGSILKARGDVKVIVITHETDNTRADWNFDDIHIFNNQDVRHIAAIMTQCELVMCPDSSVLHIASALHHPTLTLFGPTDPRARINYHPEAVCIWPAAELQCNVCWFAACINNYACWKRLDPELIKRTALAMIDDKSLPPSPDMITFGDFNVENEYYEIV